MSDLPNVTPSRHARVQGSLPRVCAPFHCHVHTHAHRQTARPLAIHGESVPPEDRGTIRNFLQIPQPVARPLQHGRQSRGVRTQDRSWAVPISPWPKHGPAVLSFLTHKMGQQAPRSDRVVVKCKQSKQAGPAERRLRRPTHWTQDAWPGGRRSASSRRAGLRSV